MGLHTNIASSRWLDPKGIKVKSCLFVSNEMFLVFNIGNKIGFHEFGNWKVDVHQGHALHVRSTLLVFILRKLFFYGWLSHIHACGQCESIVSKPSLDTQMKSLLLLAKYWEKHHEVCGPKVIEYVFAFKDPITFYWPLCSKDSS
jgi:hypothetical protein